MPIIKNKMEIKGKGKTMARKTIEVARIREKINYYLLHSSDENHRERKELAFFLGNILHETGNYKGYNYLTKEMMENSLNGSTVGIAYVTEGNTTRMEKGDDSRVFYF